MSVRRALLVLVVGFACTMPVAADGGMFWPQTVAAGSSGAQRAILICEDGLESLVLETAVETTAGYAWVVPTPGLVQAGQVREAKPFVFGLLDEVTAPTIYLAEAGPGCGCARAAHEGMALGESATPPVTVFATTRVGGYEVSTLSATESEALADWLTEHGYNIPQAATKVLADYVARHWYFTAIRVPDSAVTTDGQVSLAPLVLPFEAAEPVFPLLISSVSAAAEASDILLYVFSDGPVTTNPYPAVTLDQSPLHGTDASAAYAARVRDQARSGRGIAFVVESIQPVSPGSVALEGLSHGAASLPARCPEWSADGRTIAFEGEPERLSGDWQPYVVDADGGEPRELARSWGSGRHQAWSPDGSRVVRTSSKGLVMANADGSDRQVLLEVPTLQPGVQPAQSPAWSPDGNRVAFIYDYDVYVVNADGSDRHVVFGGPHHGISNGDTLGPLSPTWSADGDRLAFTCEAEAWVVNADGSRARQVAETSRDRDAIAWSPDGAWLAFASRRSRTEGSAISIMAPDGSCRRTLTNPEADRIDATDGEPAWSPDSTRIAFRRSSMRGSEIMVVAAAGGDATALTRRGMVCTRLHTLLSPDDMKVDVTFATVDAAEFSAALEFEPTAQARALGTLPVLLAAGAACALVARGRWRRRALAALVGVGLAALAVL
jgi:Tol biopolymer transport system component